MEMQDKNVQTPEEILLAAKELGQVLGNSPDVQALIQAETALENSAELQALDAEVQQMYQALVSRQRAGEVLPPHEINTFQKLKDQLYSHPLVIERDARLKAVQTLFGLAGSVISSILSFDFTQLVE